MRRAGWWTTTVAALLLTACGQAEPPAPTAASDGAGRDLLTEEPAGDGGVIRPYEWHLTGVSPDERLLHVSTTFGGVASDCNRWEGWAVDESDDRVVVVARMWQDPHAAACTDEGHERDRFVELAAPLGDRALVGCRHDDCRGAPLEAYAPGGSVAGAAEALVAGTPAGWFSLDPADGTERWRRGREAGRWEAGDGVLVHHDGHERTALVDPATGEDRWHVAGALVGVVDDLVLTCRGTDGGRSTEAHDLATGEGRWSVPLGCGRTVATDGDVVAVGGWRGESGPAEVAAVSRADGSERWRREAADHGGGGDLVHAAGRIFLAGVDRPLAVRVDDGTLAEVAVPAWSPFAAAEDTVFAYGDGEVVAFGADDGAVRWSVPLDAGGESRLVVDDGAVFVTDGAAGVVERRDPADGAVHWRATVGRSGRIGVAVTGDSAVAVTAVAAVALDLDGGTQRWWVPLVGG